MFADELSDWQEVEDAEFYLGRALGIFEGQYADYRGTLHVATPIGSALYDCLKLLAAAGVLEFRSEPDFQFRWLAGAEKDAWFPLEAIGKTPRDKAVSGLQPRGT